MLAMANTEEAEALKEFRKHYLRMTQEKMAEELNLKRSTYASYEEGTSIPPHIKDQLEQRWGFSPETGNPRNVKSKTNVLLPYIGSVAEGDSMLWENPLESDLVETVPAEMAEKPGRFCLRIKTDACYGKVWPGDLAVFQTGEDVPIGKLGLFRGPDHRVYLRQYRPSPNGPVLHALNAGYEDMPANGSLVGYLVGLVGDRGEERMTLYNPRGIGA